MQILINIDVPDLARAIDFYRDALGLKLSRLLFGGTVAEMAGAACPIYLLQEQEGSTAAATEPRRYARHRTPLHLDFAVENLEEAVARAQHAGATLESGPTRHRWGRIATLADPFGHGFCLLQWTGRGYPDD